MTYEEENFPVEVSKTNVVSVWERGGGCYHCGESVVVCDGDGHKKNAIFVTMPSEASTNGKHALVPIAVGDYVISVVRWRSCIDVELSRVEVVPDRAGDSVLFDPLSLYSFNAKTYNDREEYERLNVSAVFDAVQAAVKKAFRMHCKEAMYVNNKKKWIGYARTLEGQQEGGTS